MPASRNQTSEDAEGTLCLCPSLAEVLPSELLVRILMQLEPGNLSQCDQLSQHFHRPCGTLSRCFQSLEIDPAESSEWQTPLVYQPPSIVEQALRQRAAEKRIHVPSALPSNHANWTQALLFLSVLRETATRNSVAATEHHSVLVNGAGALLICGTDGIVRDKADPAPLLGLGPITGNRKIRRAIPFPHAGLAGVRVQSIAASSVCIFALAIDGTVYSWGDNDGGQLGHGDLETLAQPKRIDGLRDVCAVAAGLVHTLAITADGALWSWGSPLESAGTGELISALGHGAKCGALLQPRQIRKLSGKRMCVVAAGKAHSLAASANDECFAWGSNEDKQLGLGAPPNEYGRARRAESQQVQPAIVRDLCGERIRSVAASERASCAVLMDGAVYLWGTWGGSRRVQYERPYMTTGFGLRNKCTHCVVSIAIGTDHAVALTADGMVFAWVTSAPPQDAIVHADCLGRGQSRWNLVIMDREKVEGRVPDAQKSLREPESLSSLGSQRIRAIATGRDHSVVAGWIDTKTDVDSPFPAHAAATKGTDADKSHGIEDDEQDLMTKVLNAFKEGERKTQEEAAKARARAEALADSDVAAGKVPSTSADATTTDGKVEAAQRPQWGVWIWGRRVNGSLLAQAELNGTPEQIAELESPGNTELVSLTFTLDSPRSVHTPISQFVTPIFLHVPHDTAVVVRRILDRAIQRRLTMMRIGHTASPHRTPIRSAEASRSGGLLIADCFRDNRTD